MTEHNPFCSIAGRCRLSCETEESAIQPEYYDDEELDAYKGIAAEAYTAEQVAEFEEVMTTMRADEVHGWIISLGQRDIQFPTVLLDTAHVLMGG